MSEPRPSEMPAAERSEAAHPKLVPSLSRCPYCHESVERDEAHVSVCAGCMARHHAGCWRENASACSSCGSHARLVPRQELPLTPSAPRAPAAPEVGSRRPAALALAVVVLFGGLVAIAVRATDRAQKADARAAIFASTAEEAQVSAKRAADELAALRATTAALEQRLAGANETHRQLDLSLERERALASRLATETAPKPSGPVRDANDGVWARDLVANRLLTVRDELAQHELNDERRIHPGSVAGTLPALAARAAECERSALERLVAAADPTKTQDARAEALLQLVEAHALDQVTSKRTELRRVERAYWSLVRGEPVSQAIVALRSSK